MRFICVFPYLETTPHVEPLRLVDSKSQAVASRAQDVLHFDQVEEGFGSQQEGSRNDEAPLPPGANPTWKRQLETFDQMMIPGPWAVLG